VLLPKIITTSARAFDIRVARGTPVVDVIVEEVEVNFIKSFYEFLIL
jgi:hypothetical protein